MANYKNMGAMTFDNLANSAGDAPVITGLRTIRNATGEAVILKKGTALALSGGTAGDGKLVILGTPAAADETLTANCILNEDVEVGASSDAPALVVISGHFNRNSLAVKDGYTITDADVEAFRVAGIFLANAMI